MNNRTIASDASAEILVIDFGFLHEQYRRAIPHPERLVCVETIHAAEQLWADHQFEVLIIQGISYRENSPLSGSASNTVEFIKWTQMRGHAGPIFVPSTRLASAGIMSLASHDERVVAMDKVEFLRKVRVFLSCPSVRKQPVRRARQRLEATVGSNQERAQVLEWLDDFERAIRRGPRYAFESLTMLGVDTIETCDCLEELDDPFIRWFHVYHGVFNRAVREIIDTYSGLREALADEAMKGGEGRVPPPGKEAEAIQEWRAEAKFWSGHITANGATWELSMLLHDFLRPHLLGRFI